MSEKPKPTDGPPTLTLAEDEYLYGLGPLRLRVEKITIMRSYPGWALVGGVRIDHRGVTREHRDVCVSITTLREHHLNIVMADAAPAPSDTPTEDP